MTTRELATALGGYCAALGVSPDRVAYAVPFLTGEKKLPSEAENLADDLADRAANVRLLTYPEAAKLRGCSRHTIYRMTKDGTLTPVVCRGKNKIRLADLLALDETPETVGACHCGGACAGGSWIGDTEWNPDAFVE